MPSRFFRIHSIRCSKQPAMEDAQQGAKPSDRFRIRSSSDPHCRYPGTLLPTFPRCFVQRHITFPYGLCTRIVHPFNVTGLGSAVSFTISSAAVDIINDRRRKAKIKKNRSSQALQRLRFHETICRDFSDSLACTTSVAAEVKWEASLDQAKVRARATGKPILLMHLFGRLDQEFT